ncbi:MAG TPA: acyl carrier protein [Steroidobacteraceae bacterium]|jgi:acyl carrier protein|nr:acyl carrier protein [Steroidobacteraceae bacterium]
MQDPILIGMTSVFREVFDDDELELKPEMTADDVDGWDSLAHIRLILSVQRAFGIKFSPVEMNRLKNVGDLIALTKDKQRQGAAR